MKSILILVATVVVMAAAAFLVTKMVIKPALAPGAAENASAKVKPEKTSEKGGKDKVEVYLVSNLLVNPTGTGGTRYLSASVGIQVDSPGVLDQLRVRDLQVRDLLILVLSSRTVEELTDPRSREQMRKEILERLNQLIGGEELSAVYFVDYVLQ